jgi:hypothetical protein
MDLSDGTYRPFNKPNNPLNYIHADSNHPPSIIKQIPKAISKRISNNSSSREIFDNAAPLYNNALEKSGYREKLTYCPDPETDERIENPRRKRSRNIIWFNPPFSKDVETNVAKTLLNLVKKHFPQNHTYHKIFNKNNVKVSYGCLENMGKIVKKHNQQILQEPDPTERSCNCIRAERDNCPLDGKCYLPNVVYNAHVSTEDGNPTKVYKGTSKPPWKNRLATHKRSFINRDYNPTCLSEHIWNLKEKGINYNIKWTLERRTSGYSSVSKSCSLCLTEKFLIAEHKNKDTLINKRNELVNKCRHDRDTCFQYQ